jgi:hypothetical protein
MVLLKTSPPLPVPTLQEVLSRLWERDTGMLLWFRMVLTSPPKSPELLELFTGEREREEEETHFKRRVVSALLFDNRDTETSSGLDGSSSLDLLLHPLTGKKRKVFLTDKSVCRVYRLFKREKKKRKSVSHGAIAVTFDVLDILFTISFIHKRKKMVCPYIFYLKVPASLQLGLHRLSYLLCISSI